VERAEAPVRLNIYTVIVLRIARALALADGEGEGIINS
jgi:hypothetical protein